MHYIVKLSDRIAQESDPVLTRQHLKEVDTIFQRSLIAYAEGHVNSGTLVAIQATVNRCHRSAELNIAV